MIWLESRKMEVEVDLVEAKVPMLILKKQLEEWRAKLDFKDGVLEFKNTSENIKMGINPQKTHFVLPVVNMTIIAAFIVQKKKTRHDINNTPETYQDIKQVHRVLGHCSEDSMRNLYRQKNALDWWISKLIKIVCFDC